MTGLQRRARERLLDRDPRPFQPFHALAGDRRDHELVAVHEHDLGRAGVDQSARALDDQLQDAVEIRLAAQRAADLRRRLETADGALELVAALTDGPIQAGVADRDRGPVGEHHGGLLVVVGELAAVLLRQVEVSPRLSLDDDRHAEEGGHRGMGERESVGLRVRADVRQTQRPRLGDQHPENPAAAGQVADGAMGVLVDAGREEALEALAPLVEHADGRVARARQLARDLEQALEHRFGIELGDERPPDVQQAPEPPLIHGIVLVGRRARCLRIARSRLQAGPALYGSKTIRAVTRPASTSAIASLTSVERPDLAGDVRLARGVQLEDLA